MGSSLDEEDGSSARNKDQFGLMFGLLRKISRNNHAPHDAVRQSEDALLLFAKSCRIHSAGSDLVSSESCSGLSVKSATDAKVQLRKKHQPQHRCPSVNGSVTGIVKAPRYSGNTSLTHQATDRRGSWHDTPTDNGRRCFTQMMPRAISETNLQHMESLFSKTTINDTASITASTNSNATGTEK